MIEVSYGPEWFYLVSIFIDIISVVVLFLIASTAIKYYKLNNSKNYGKLGFSFSLIAISFIFKLMTSITVYYEKFRTQEVTQTVVQVAEAIRSYNILADLSFLLFVLFGLAGIYALYSIKRRQQSSTVFLIIYFILLSIYTSTFLSSSSYYIFHLTSMILLILIASRYFNVYTRNKNENTKYLAYGFSILATSQALFMFITLSRLFYVFAEVVQVIGYVLLLTVLIMVLNYGKKKKQN